MKSEIYRFMKHIIAQTVLFISKKNINNPPPAEAYGGFHFRLFYYNYSLTYDPVRKNPEDQCFFQGYPWSVREVSGKILSVPDLPR